MSDNDNTTNGEQNVEKEVRLNMPAWLIEEYPDGSALVDADGKEILVSSEEWKYDKPQPESTDK